MAFSILTLFMSSVGSTIFAGEPDKKFHEECLYPTAMIVGQCGQTNSFGTGVVVKSVKSGEHYTNYVFTVAHIAIPKLVDVTEHENERFSIRVTRPVYKIRLGKYKDWSIYEGYHEFDAKIIFQNTKDDIIVMSFQTNFQIPIATIYKHPKLYIGNDIVKIGCGIAEPFRVDFGKINSLKESQDKVIAEMQNTYRITANTVEGDSGGPVYHECKVIGVTQAIRRLDQGNPVFHMAYVIPIERFLHHEEVRKLLE